MSLPNKLLKEKCSGQKSAENRPDTLFLVDVCSVKMRVGRKKRFPCIKKTNLDYIQLALEHLKKGKQELTVFIVVFQRCISVFDI